MGVTHLLDSVRSAILAANPFQRIQQDARWNGIVTPQLAFSAYLASGMMRKVINIPAHDRVREWRDWQAEKEQIEALEAEERRLGLVAKIKHAEVLRGLGGGALILAVPGDPALPINSRALGRGQLAAVNVVSRWQISGEDYVRELTDPAYGTPRMFRVEGEGRQQRIHPSRVVCFRGDPLPMGAGISEEDAFWGDSRLVRVLREVQNSDNTQLWFSQLVRKAKLLRVGIPKLTDFTSTEAGQAKLNSRVSLIATGEDMLNATVYQSGAPEDAETITDYQVTWAGIPAMMDAFDQRVAAVADIPFTRLMGRSPAGMNATGAYDDLNWVKAVVAGQNLELRPCLEQLDEPLMRSAGVGPAGATWRFAPLSAPTEKEQADTFNVLMDAITKLQNTGTIPDIALSKAVQNLLAEREDLPGLDQALGELSEDERFGISPEPGDDDPSALTQQQEGGDPVLGGGAGVGSAPARRAANDARFMADAEPRTLYVQRKLLNAAELIRWAKGQGFDTTTPADELHVTIAFSRARVDWMKVGQDWSSDRDGRLTVNAGGPRIVEPLGDKGAVVLLFQSNDLKWRHDAIKEAGASFDFPEYQPHVTITYKMPEGFDLSKVEPFTGPLVFGPELFSEVVENWEQGVTEE